MVYRQLHWASKQRQEICNKSDEHIIVIWAVLDPANRFVTQTSAPFTIGLAYSVMVWGFANVAISTNLARDVGHGLLLQYSGEATLSVIMLLFHSWS